MDSSIISPDPATKEEVTPQYDSSEEWEIGLGNLIIDLDADLEKDRQDVPSADSSPMRIGKMKIKRKVSSSKGDVAVASPRKDPASSTNEEALPTSTATTPAHHTSPERLVTKQDVVAKPRVVIHHKKDLGMKQDKTFLNPAMSNASKGPVIVSPTSMTPANTPNPTVLLNTSIATSIAAPPPPLPQQQPKHTDILNHSIPHTSAVGGNPMNMLTVNTVKLPETKDSEKKIGKAENRGGEEEVKVKEDGKKKEEKEVKGETNNKKEGSHSGGPKKHGGKKGKNEKVRIGK